ncbi:Delta(3,5)-Delta(2,4)-dienoyl-CoA isomerase, mitochondrial [Porphyridium purpureum]|uniref:Delta(3,5)-Delta(2,4)-dienoyl-CoA isomerase, mitochondrial n=1 Tax=Porphyridium purpureum TaxID=35688 RepID=A0A5J4YX03_PORPP|nr:Delta(3,5)-Delta(2,4)-dienoyl-CoA isomerase, mitochondrial [Porphyridium purpureum]|eukprot:POR0451..scf209_3
MLRSARAGDGDVDCRIAVVTLDRPSQRNALTSAFFRECRDLFESFNGSDVRAVVIRSSGSDFCAGIDLELLVDMARRSDALSSGPGTSVAQVALGISKELESMQAAFDAIERCDAVVVAAVQGACLGSGLELVLAADITVCEAETATFGLIEPRLGLCADLGGIQRLGRKCSASSELAELMYTARIFDAETAARLGIVSRVSNHDAFAQAIEIARQVARHDALGVLGTKQNLRLVRDGHSMQHALLLQRLWSSSALQSPAILERGQQMLQAKRETTPNRASKL